MIELDILIKSWFFKEVFLKKWEVLFHEGEINPFLYIIYEGEARVEKSIVWEAWTYKTLWSLKKWDIIWEGSISENAPKEVQIVCTQDTHLLYIHSHDTFPIFLERYPKDAYLLLLKIIKLSNNRLLQANRELTANYEISSKISTLEEINVKSIFSLLDTFEAILKADQILYIEKSTALDEYYKLKYNSYEAIKAQNIILHFSKNIFSYEKLEKEHIELMRYYRSISLSIGNEIHGFLVISRAENDFNESEERLLQNIATSFVWIIHQKQLQEEQKNKNYIKEI